VERELLPNAELKPVYEDVVWVFVYNDFKGGEADLAADRVRKRFSVSTWPQLLIADPNTLEVIGHTGRSVKTFLPAVSKAKAAVSKLDKQKQKEVREKLEAAETFAARLQTKPNKRDLQKALEHNDVVVLAVAVEHAAKEDPAMLFDSALKLLDNTSDQIRTAVCDAIAKADDKANLDEGLSTRIEGLITDPKGSRNPNVLRIKAVGALARCGNAESLDVIKPFATSGDVYNGLTGKAVDAIGAIGLRDKGGRDDAIAILVDSFPSASADDPKRAEAFARVAPRLAQTVHKHLEALTRAKVAFPAKYDEAGRNKLIEAFSKHVKESSAAGD
jgi:hypothetical protein